MSDKREFIISTDSTADLPEEYVKAHGLWIMPLYYTVDNVQYGGANDLPLKKYYEMMRSGSLVTTSASNPDVILQRFSEAIAKDVDILHISFSSGLSCSYNNTCMIANELMEDNPGVKITVVDSLCASLGHGLIVYYAVKMKEEGKSMDEIAAWLEENKLHFCHQFTVEDLKYLQRGGRISKTVAVLGTLINVKPVLHVDNEGHLVPMSNVRGRKKSLISLVENMERQSAGIKQETVFISHCDAEEDAAFVAGLVRERFGIEPLIVNYISPTIGAHSGPGTVALFHLGKNRED